MAKQEAIEKNLGGEKLEDLDEFHLLQSLRKEPTKALEDKIIALAEKGESWQVRHNELIKIDKRFGKTQGADRTAFRKVAHSRFPHSEYFKNAL